jgi:hypothetical protein
MPVNFQTLQASLCSTVSTLFMPPHYWLLDGILLVWRKVSFPGR